jgi:hypothetical protein
MAVGVGVGVGVCVGVDVAPAGGVFAGLLKGFRGVAVGVGVDGRSNVVAETMGEGSDVRVLATAKTR